MNDVLNEIFPADPELEKALDESEVMEGGEVFTLGHAVQESEKRGDARDEIVTKLANMLLRKEIELEAFEATYKPVVAHIDSERKYLKQRIEAIEREIKMVLPAHTGWETMTNSAVDIFYVESESLVVDDERAVPLQLTKEVPDNEKIKKYLQSLPADAPTPFWAHLQRKFNLNVKKSGPRQIANAKKRAKNRVEREEEKRQLAQSPQPPAKSPQIAENSAEK
jgi:hypothetical protein